MMIAKSNVSQIGLKRISQRFFSVGGYEGKLGYYPVHKKRTFKTYEQACRYSIELRDYYQAPIVEF